MAAAKGKVKPKTPNPIIGKEYDDSDWLRSHWRPAMAWAYMAICLFDFIIAPTGVAMLITFYKSTMPIWQSLTLENGGIVHIAFGAILGVSAWGRTKESVISQQYGPYQGGGGVIYNQETEYMEPAYRRRRQQRPNEPNEPNEPNQPRPKPISEEEPDVIVPKPRPPVID
jgi:Holin of 3TMs, for gene-transfer release